MSSLVVMGVAGCGKSSLARSVAQAQGMKVVEGDDFHGEASRAKMQAGVPLTDADRAGWLQALGEQLSLCPEGLVLTCSALKRSYRDRLRAAATDLRFVFIEIGREEAHARVAARAATHFFSASLVDSQFATLEPPTSEPGVLTVDARVPLQQLQQQVIDWLNLQGKQ